MFKKAENVDISHGYIDKDNYNTIDIDIKDYSFWDKDGNLICHNCYNRIGYGNNCRCSIDKKRVDYMTKCRHNQNVNQKDIEESIKEMNKLLKNNEKFDYDKFLAGYNFIEKKVMDNQY